MLLGKPDTPMNKEPIKNEQTKDEQAQAIALDKVRNQFSYRVGEYSILLETEIRTEVVDVRPVSEIPFSPDWCAGLSSSRGELYPVMNMHKVFLDRESPATIKLLLVHHPKFSPLILACDGYDSQLNVPVEPSNIKQDDSLPAWISHSLTHNSQTLLVADHARLLRHIQRTSTPHIQ